MALAGLSLHDHERVMFAVQAIAASRPAVLRPPAEGGRQSTKAPPAEGGRQSTKTPPAEGGRQSSDHRQTGVTVLQQASIVVSAGMLLLRLRQGHDFMSCGLAGPFLHVSDMHNPCVYGYEYDYE